jgi:hypothetical protein
MLTELSTTSMHSYSSTNLLRGSATAEADDGVDAIGELVDDTADEPAPQ